MINLHLAPPNTHDSNSLFTWMSMRAELTLTLILVLSIVQLMLGFPVLSCLVQIAGSLLSMGILFGLSRGIRRFLTSAPRYIPYLFGLYLFFVSGFWNLTFLLKDFSIFQILLSAFYMLAGSALATTGYTAIYHACRLREGH